MGWEDIKRKSSDKQEEIESSPNVIHYRTGEELWFWVKTQQSCDVLYEYRENAN